MSLERLPDPPLPAGSLDDPSVAVAQVALAIGSHDRTQRAEAMATIAAMEAAIVERATPPPAERRDPRPLAEAIVGAWHGAAMNVTFSADGAATAAMANGMAVAGRWSVGGDGKLRLDGMGQDMATDAWIAGDALTVVMDGTPHDVPTGSRAVTAASLEPARTAPGHPLRRSIPRGEPRSGARRRGAGGRRDCGRPRLAAQGPNDSSCEPPGAASLPRDGREATPGRSRRSPSPLREPERAGRTVAGGRSWHGAFVQVRRVAEAERRVPRFEPRAFLEVSRSEVTTEPSRRNPPLWPVTYALTELTAPTGQGSARS